MMRSTEQLTSRQRHTAQAQARPALVHIAAGSPGMVIAALIAAIVFTVGFVELADAMVAAILAGIAAVTIAAFLTGGSGAASYTGKVGRWAR